MNNLFTATVISNTYLADNLSVLKFKSDMPSIVPGQYISVLIPDGSAPEGKAYSLATATGDTHHTLVVRKVGEYSSFLYHLTLGETFQHSPGYGHFNPNITEPLIGLASGTGISPVWSIILSNIRTNPNQSAQLVYSTRNEADAALLSDLKAEAEKGSLKLFHHQTRNPEVKLSTRINPTDYIDQQATYLICGSADFVRSMYQGLIEERIDQHKIYTEVFFE